jgi:hypothetical protein
MEQVIRKELIEKFIKRFNENPNEVAEVVLRERFEYRDLKNNYEWLESENEFHQNFISTEEYQKSEDEYYESLKYLKQIYFENNN